MTVLQQILATIGAIFGIAAIGGATWSIARGAQLENTVKRLREDNAEYIKRIEYIEPRWQSAMEQNTLLRELGNPTEQLTRMESTQDQIKHNQERMMKVLDSQHETLDEVATELHRKGPRDSSAV